MEPAPPLRRIGSGPERRCVPRGGRRATDRPGNYPTLLVADSYERARALCVGCLHQSNFQVVHTADGEEALALIHATSPHVILTEIDLPAMPAWRLSQWITESGMRIPIIVMVDDSDKDSLGLMRQPPAGVLEKPFSPETMLDSVRRVLRAGMAVSQPAVGETVSHYRILELLGAGSMGVVYKAEDSRLKRLVALKFLPIELTRDHEAKERLIQEAQSASALDHPNICTIHEIDETPDGRLFLAMAYYDGETLKQRLARTQPRDVGVMPERHGAEASASGGSLEPRVYVGPHAPSESPLRGLKIDEAVDIAAQVAKAVAAAHDAHIVHRDIKSANIMVTRRGDVKLLDFGLAKLAGQTSALTRAGTAVGTVAYMSPEQITGVGADQRSDVWAVGVVLYEMLTGSLPFRGDNDAAVLYNILNKPPRPPREQRPEISEALERVVLRALEKDPGARFASAHEFLQELLMPQCGQ